MIESWGRGMERIMTACKTAKVLTPKLRYERTGIWVEFKVPEGVRPEKSFSAEPKGSGKSSGKGSVKMSDRILMNRAVLDTSLDNNQPQPHKLSVDMLYQSFPRGIAVFSSSGSCPFHAITPLNLFAAVV